jgi:hypothetical protein
MYLEWDSNPHTLAFKTSRSAGWRIQAMLRGRESNRRLLGQSQGCCHYTTPEKASRKGGIRTHAVQLPKLAD